MISLRFIMSSEHGPRQASEDKGSSGRLVPVAKDLRAAMIDWRIECGALDQEGRIVTTERTVATSAQAVVNMFADRYRTLGFTGCSSRSGHRTFITNAARKISTVGGSLRDVQALAGHSPLTTTQRYIEVNAEAKRRVVETLQHSTGSQFCCCIDRPPMRLIELKTIYFENKCSLLLPDCKCSSENARLNPYLTD